MGDGSFALLNLRFNNFNIAVGTNTIMRDIIYPEVKGYSNTKLKNAFLIDMRFDFRTFKGLRFSPNLEWWSWGEFPKQGTVGVENAISCLDLNFDINHFIFQKNTLHPYIGTGICFHFTFTESVFPREMFKEVPIVVRQITEKQFNPGINFIAGSDFYIDENITLFSEFRYEYINKFNQIKFLIGISTF